MHLLSDAIGIYSAPPPVKYYALISSGSIIKKHPSPLTIYEERVRPTE